MGAVTVDEGLVEPARCGRGALRTRRQAELLIDDRQQLVEREFRIIDVDDPHVLAVRAAEVTPEYRRLAQADVPGDRYEPLALLDPVDDGGESLAMRPAREKEVRVRGYLERLLVQLVEIGRATGRTRVCPYV